MDFRTSVLPYRDRLFRLALSITLDAAEAEDIVQDTMMKAWERRGEWDTIQNMPAWLLQTCKNLALDHKKKEKFETRRVSLTSESASAHPDTYGNPAVHDTGVEERESMSLLRRLISELPSPMDDLVFLRDIEGLSYREIAAQLNLSEDQVRVYLHRARVKVRERYAAIQGFGL